MGLVVCRAGRMVRGGGGATRELIARSLERIFERHCTGCEGFE